MKNTWDLDVSLWPKWLDICFPYPRVLFFSGDDVQCCPQCSTFGRQGGDGSRLKKHMSLEYPNYWVGDEAWWWFLKPKGLWLAETWNASVLGVFVGLGRGKRWELAQSLLRQRGFGFQALYNFTGKCNHQPINMTPFFSRILKILVLFRITTIHWNWSILNHHRSLPSKDLSQHFQSDCFFSSHLPTFSHHFFCRYTDHLISRFCWLKPTDQGDGWRASAAHHRQLLLRHPELWAGRSWRWHFPLKEAVVKQMVKLSRWCVENWSFFFFPNHFWYNVFFFFFFSRDLFRFFSSWPSKVLKFPHGTASDEFRFLFFFPCDVRPIALTWLMSCCKCAPNPVVLGWTVVTFWWNKTRQRMKKPWGMFAKRLAKNMRKWRQSDQFGLDIAGLSGHNVASHLFVSKAQRFLSSPARVDEMDSMWETKKRIAVVDGWVIFSKNRQIMIGVSKLSVDIGITNGWNFSMVEIGVVPRCNSGVLGQQIDVTKSCWRFASLSVAFLCQFSPCLASYREEIPSRL